MLFGFASNNDPIKNPQSTAPMDPDAELLEEEEESIGDEINKTLVALMPWGISILLHVALVVVAFFLVWQTIINEPPKQKTIPSTNLADTPLPPAKMQEMEQQNSDSSLVVSVDPTPVPSPSVTDTNIKSTLQGLQFKGGTPGGSIGTSTGTGDLGVDLFGADGNARNIAFIVDASGSMVDVLPFVINELKRVVRGLKEEQKITIIFFSGDGVDVVPGAGNKLQPCTTDFKERVREWVSLDSFEYGTGGRGSQNVVAAIEKALNCQPKPELVYLLSDNLTGGGQGATLHEIFQDELMASIRKANKGGTPAMFNTIQFLYEDPLVRQGLKGTLQLIADDTGGTYKFITARDLNLQ